MDLRGPLTCRRAGQGCGAPASAVSNLEGALLKSEPPLPQGIYSYSWYFMSKIGLTSDLIRTRKPEKMALSYCFNCILAWQHLFCLKFPPSSSLHCVQFSSWSQIQTFSISSDFLVAFSNSLQQHYIKVFFPGHDAYLKSLYFGVLCLTSLAVHCWGLEWGHHIHCPTEGDEGVSEPSPAPGGSAPMKLWAQRQTCPSLGHAGPSLWVPSPAPSHLLYIIHPRSSTDQV